MKFGWNGGGGASIFKIIDKIWTIDSVFRKFLQMVIIHDQGFLILNLSSLESLGRVAGLWTK